jgi:aminoglycoside phosphotransferase (APT) family kinase protein
MTVSGTGYRYLRLGKYLACLDQSILSVVKSIGLGYKRNQLDSIGISRSIAKVAIRALIKDKLRLLGPGNVVELPAFGHIGMQVHRGGKVFDFDRQVAIKIFGPEADSRAAAMEIAASKQASEVAAAPRFIAEDAGMAWYAEEYICGIHATDAEFRDGAEILDFYPDVEECLLDLVACQPATSVDTTEHVNSSADMSFQNRWLDAGVGTKTVDEVVAYVERLREWLVNQPKPDQLQLVLTHGDFSLVNAISTVDGLRFIDWEGVAPGGLYSDIFHFLFAERYYERTSDNFPLELTVIVEKYREAARARFPELHPATEINMTFARRQYYLERLCLLLNRAESPNLSKVVSNSITTFRDFDHEVGDAAI